MYSHSIAAHFEVFNFHIHYKTLGQALNCRHISAFTVKEACDAAKFIWSKYVLYCH